MTVDTKSIPAYSNPMFGFLIKKSFYDLWDNLFRVVLVNLVFLAFLIAAVLVLPLFESLPLLGLVFLGFFMLLCFVYLSTAALTLKAISDYSSFGFADFFRNLKSAWPAGVLLGILFFLGFLFVTMGIPFYFNLGSFLGLLLGSLLFWTLLIGILALQFYFPIRSRLDTKFFKIIKKCFLILLDNSFFCIMSGIVSLVILALSLPLLFLLPGPGGVLLFLDEALRIRLLKYDWLEANPNADRRKIPWDVLLVDEREKTGTRTLKGLIFPWKD
ncbi:hypothetical protein [Treponema primitia]|uniref:hypothetical protein n=1 Tax=Treponema primitia TaxID=88058 RepID=UPI0002DF04A1|nr:hypothetical protein [Treponema primitia]